MTGYGPGPRLTPRERFRGHKRPFGETTMDRTRRGQSAPSRESSRQEWSVTGRASNRGIRYLGGRWDDRSRDLPRPPQCGRHVGCPGDGFSVRRRRG